MHYDASRIYMFGINPISTRFIQHGHKWKLKEHSNITWYNFWGEKKIWEEKRKDKKENKNQREWIGPLTRKPKKD